MNTDEVWLCMVMYDSFQCVLYRFVWLFFDGTGITRDVLRWGAVKLPTYLSIQCLNILHYNELTMYCN